MKGKKQVIFSTKWIAYTALLTAFVVAMGYVPGLPVGGGKIYWCDFAIFIAAYLLDPVASMIVGGVGTTFFDLFGINGTAYMALPSLLIHGLQGLSAGLLFMLFKTLFRQKTHPEREIWCALLASVIPALLVIWGYFIKRTAYDGYAPALAFTKMPANVLQELIGIAVAVIILYVLGLKKQLKKANLLPEWTFKKN